MNEKYVLLVEDNDDDADLALRAFRKQAFGCTISRVRDGAEAVEFLSVGESDASGLESTLPALVLLDLHLPKMDGLEVLRRIRANERTRSLPVVVMTSSNEEQDLVEAYRNHVNSFVRKPIDFEKFTEALKLLGMYWLILNEPPPTSLGRLVRSTL